MTISTQLVRKRKSGTLNNNSIRKRLSYAGSDMYVDDTQPMEHESETGFDNVHRAFRILEGSTAITTEETIKTTLRNFKHCLSESKYPIDRKTVALIQGFVNSGNMDYRLEGVKTIYAMGGYNGVETAHFVFECKDCLNGMLRCVTNEERDDVRVAALVTLARLCCFISTTTKPPMALVDIIHDCIATWYLIPAPADMLNYVLVVYEEILKRAIDCVLTSSRLRDATIGLLKMVEKYHPKKIREDDPRKLTKISLRCLQKLASRNEACGEFFGIFGKSNNMMPTWLRKILKSSPHLARAECCCFLSNLIGSDSRFIPFLLDEDTRVLKCLVLSADINEDGQNSCLRMASLRVLARIVRNGSREVVKSAVDLYVFNFFEDFLRRDDPGKAEVITDVLYAIERICMLRLGAYFGGWDAVDNLALSLPSGSEAEEVALRLLDERSAGSYPSENDGGHQISFVASSPGTGASKRRKLCSEAPVLGISNRHH